MNIKAIIILADNKCEKIKQSNDMKKYKYVYYPITFSYKNKYL